MQPAHNPGYFLVGFPESLYLDLLFLRYLQSVCHFFSLADEQAVEHVISLDDQL
jgi:hypothetical protein